MPKSRKRSKTVYAVFGFLTALPVLALLAAFLILPKREYSPREKRALADAPVLSIETLLDGSFMNDAETFMSDQFPFRDVCIAVKARLSLALGIRESQDVYYLADGSLAERFTEPDDDARQELQDEIARFAARYPQARFYFMLVPSAVSVKSSLLPAFAQTDDQYAYIGSFFDALPAAVKAVDVREEYRAAASSAKLYYNTDHHWSDEGVRIAAAGLYEKMGLSGLENFESGVVSNSFVGALTAKSGFPVKEADSVTIYRPKEDSDADVLYTVNYLGEHKVTASIYDAEALKGDNAYEVFLGGNHPAVTIETSLDSDRSLLIFRDSYANAMLPLLLPYYKTITVVDPRYYYEDIDLLMQTGDYDAVLFLYCASTLSEDRSLATVLRNEQ